MGLNRAHQPTVLNGLESTLLAVTIVKGVGNMLLEPFREHVPARTIGPWDREFILTTGTATFLLGAFLAFDPTSHQELFLGWLWPWYFMVVGAATIVYGFWPRSTNLHAFTGAALMVGTVGRAIALSYAVLGDHVPADHLWRSVSGVVIWLLLGRQIRRTWHTVMPLPPGVEVNHVAR